MGRRQPSTFFYRKRGNPVIVKLLGLQCNVTAPLVYAYRNMGLSMGGGIGCFVR